MYVVLISSGYHTVYLIDQRENSEITGLYAEKKTYQVRTF